jgi:ATP-dependent Lon protease
MDFEPRVLNTLPLPAESDSRRMLAVLEALLRQRICPYFRQRLRVDATTVTRAAEQTSIQRLDDPEARVRTVSLLSRQGDRWTVHLHERVFDYLVFAMPSDPETRLAEAGVEQRRALAFAEFLLRHELEHVIYPGRAEEQVVASDIAFAMHRKKADPTYHRTLLEALGDEMTGLKSGPYLALIRARERKRDWGDRLTSMLNDHAERLAAIDREVLARFLSAIHADTKTRIIESSFRRSTSTEYSLFERAESLDRALWLFHELLGADETEGARVFHTFQDRWGAALLLSAMGIPAKVVQKTPPEALFTLFSERLRERFAVSVRRPEPSIPPSARALPEEAEPARKSLKERVEEAKRDPRFPAQVLEVIDKNQVNAVGHSGAKYSELIETLLAVPWGRSRPITVAPREFEAGLDRSHYGLYRPKEILCDFFGNLIWRCQQPDRRVDDGQRFGSAFLFVGPPGVGKTSLAISIAENLGLPYHKLSLGGMRDETDLRGHGFTYEGSKPGAIVQGLIKMEAMNGLFILDEADKTEAFAIATLLEILDPEQNHLFHDKYTQTTVDIDLSDCHFILTANTLETVPPPVQNRCEIVVLDRYSVEEKVAIAREHLIPRIRRRHQLDRETICFEPGHEAEHVRHLVRTYTFEAGVRELERVIRTLLLRIQRKEVFHRGRARVSINRTLIKQHLEEPSRPRQIAPKDRAGESLGLGVNVALGVGSLIPIQATGIRSGSATQEDGSALSMVHATGNLEKVMDESRKVATTAVLHCADELGLRAEQLAAPVHLHFMGGSTPKDGPSAGGAIALALASLAAGLPLRRDVAMTGEIDTQGRLSGIGGLAVKLESAVDAGCKTVIIPKDNLAGAGGVERFAEPLKRELQILSYPEWRGEHEPFDYGRHVLQVVAVEHLVEAFDVAVVREEEIARVERTFVDRAQEVAAELPAAPLPHREDVLVVVAKRPDELEEDLFDAPPCDRHLGCCLVMPPESQRSTAERFPRLEACARMVTFDPHSETLGDDLSGIVGTSAGAESAPHAAVVAPYFLLRQAELRDRLGQRADVQLFASNYALQGVKLKHCKRVLHRTYAVLANLGRPAIERCWFVAQQDGIHLVDLSPIPEKYRLDVARAETIVNRCLSAWLRALADSRR